MSAPSYSSAQNSSDQSHSSSLNHSDPAYSSSQNHSGDLAYSGGQNYSSDLNYSGGQSYLGGQNQPSDQGYSSGQSHSSRQSYSSSQSQSSGLSYSTSLMSCIGHLVGSASSPTDWQDARSPSGEGDPAADNYTYQPQSLARECEPSAGREIDRTMLSRLGSARPDFDFRVEGALSPQLKRENVFFEEPSSTV